MADSQKILWDEGMLLTPQHFQQWDRYFESLLRQRIRSLRALDWGLNELKIDEAALLGGEFCLERCQGVMKDGFFFDAPTRDPLPPGRGFKDEFQAQYEVLDVYLGMPILRSGGLACALSGDDSDVPRPFMRRTLTVTDETRPGYERELGTIVANLRILLTGDAIDEYTTIKISEVKRKATGGYELNEDWVPPCQYMSASPKLMKILRRVIEMLSSKSEDLAGQQRKTAGMAEAAGFWLLHTVNSHLPTIMHYYHQERVHPELAFLELGRLAGALCTFAGSEHPRELPIYDHANIGQTFGALDSKLQDLLGTVAPSRCIPIPLERIGESLFSASLNDDRLLQDSQLYLSVYADVEEGRLVAEIPAKAKISSRDRVEQLITMALRGLPLKHTPNPPQDIPIQPGRLYFKLEKAGDHWDVICQSHSISIQVPPEFPGLRMELMGVKE